MRETKLGDEQWRAAEEFVVLLGDLMEKVNEVDSKPIDFGTGVILHRSEHPQYLALMVAGLGMLLIWPRFLVLIGFVTVLLRVRSVA